MKALCTTTSNLPRGLGAFVLIWGTLVGCAPSLHAIPVDPAVDFAAHVEHRGMVIDEMPGASPAVLVPAGWRYLTGGPRFLLQAHDKTLAAIWFPNPGQMIVRQTADPHSTLVGEIDATWDHGAICLALTPAGGSAFQTGEFDRIDGRFATAALSSQAQSLLDMRGTYRAPVRDAQGVPVGWLRVRISPYQAAGRIYDGDLPTALNGPLATAAVALVDADVDVIEGHALNPYLGN
jgi:hypothetical protein